jgi:hypothetical protein
MGKAGKWIRNFLLGKREQKYKKNDSSFSAEHHHPSTQPGSPRVKKRWSFGRAAGKRTSHKFSKSLDSIETTKLPIQATAENDDVENVAATKIQAVFRSYLVQTSILISNNLNIVLVCGDCPDGQEPMERQFQGLSGRSVYPVWTEAPGSAYLGMSERCNDVSRHAGRQATES